MLKVSIITVCYNSAETIQDTIESVFSQTYSNIEYIIIDGASNDKTLDIIGKYQSLIHHFVSEPDRGLYDAMNKGIAVATGDIVGILNSDDFYETNSVIEDVVEAFVLYPKYQLLYGGVVYVNPERLDNIVRTYCATRFKPWKMRFGWMPPHPATFIRKSVYESAGLYSLKYKIASDYEMFIRLLVVKKNCYGRLNQVLVRMRAGGISTAGIKSKLCINHEIIRACRDNGVYTNSFLTLLKIPFKLYELWR